ncbi:MAG: hypothetical protein GKR94_10005 [Gammaproteobacteria bacterium]|nr:hypothetical protein [Gammaproteobacteria bacterium]
MSSAYPSYGGQFTHAALELFYAFAVSANELAVNTEAEESALPAVAPLACVEVDLECQVLLNKGRL